MAPPPVGPGAKRHPDKFHTGRAPQALRPLKLFALSLMAAATQTNASLIEPVDEQRSDDAAGPAVHHFLDDIDTGLTSSPPSAA